MKFIRFMDLLGNISVFHCLQITIFTNPKRKKKWKLVGRYSGMWVPFGVRQAKYLNNRMENFK